MNCNTYSRNCKIGTIRQGSDHLYIYRDADALPGVGGGVVVVAAAHIHPNHVGRPVEVLQEVGLCQVGTAPILHAGRGLGHQVHQAKVPVARPVLDQIHRHVPVNIFCIRGKRSSLKAHVPKIAY